MHKRIVLGVVCVCTVYKRSICATAAMNCYKIRIKYEFSGMSPEIFIVHLQRTERPQLAAGIFALLIIFYLY